MSRHHRNDDNYSIAWWRREIGGAPMWMLIATLMVVAGVVIYAALNRA